MRMLVGFASLATIIGYCLYRGHAAKAVKREIKEDLHRWESEGGNVPAVATPSPAPTPTSSYGANPSIARH